MVDKSEAGIVRSTADLKVLKKPAKEKETISQMNFYNSKGQLRLPKNSFSIASRNGNVSFSTAKSKNSVASLPPEKKRKIYIGRSLFRFHRTWMVIVLDCLSPRD